MQTTQLAGRRFGALWRAQVANGNRYLHWLEYACWILGLAAAGWYFFVWAHTLYFQNVQAKQFAILRGKPMAHAELQTGELLGKLTIARIGLSVVVLEGDDEQTLRQAVGHIPGTALPDAVGTVALAAHRDTFFRDLGSLRTNDVIVLETRTGTYRYRVATTGIVDPTDVAVLQSTGGRVLRLVTCYPFHYIGPAPQRFIVTAWQVPDSRRDSPVHGLFAKATFQSPKAPVQAGDDPGFAAEEEGPTRKDSPRGVAAN